MAEIETVLERTGKLVHSREFPDLGLKAPKSKEARVACEEAVTNCISALEELDNFDNFVRAAISMFNQFGIPLTDNEDEKAWTLESLRFNYDEWQKRAQDPQSNGVRFADIEMRTPKNGYVNIYIEKVYVGERLALNIVPGACSTLNARERTSEYLPVKDFYTIFKDTIDTRHRFGEQRTWKEKLMHRK